MPKPVESKLFEESKPRGLVWSRAFDGEEWNRSTNNCTSSDRYIRTGQVANSDSARWYLCIWFCAKKAKSATVELLYFDSIAPPFTRPNVSQWCIFIDRFRNSLSRTRPWPGSCQSKDKTFWWPSEPRVRTAWTSKKITHSTLAHSSRSLLLNLCVSICRMGFVIWLVRSTVWSTLTERRSVWDLRGTQTVYGKKYQMWHQRKNVDMQQHVLPDVKDGQLLHAGEWALRFGWICQFFFCSVLLECDLLAKKVPAERPTVSISWSAIGRKWIEAKPNNLIRQAKNLQSNKLTIKPTPWVAGQNRCKARIGKNG